MTRNIGELQDMNQRMDGRGYDGSFYRTKEEINQERTYNRVKENEYKKLEREHEKLLEEFTKLLENNRILRSITKVPDNFGHEIDIEVLRHNHQGALEDWQALAKRLEEENKDLKEERENMSYKMRQLVVLYSNKSHDPKTRYKNLTPEAVEKLDEYALNLKDGIDRVPLNDISQKLNTEVIELKAKLQFANEKSNQIVESMLNTMHTRIIEAINKLDTERGAVQPENYMMPEDLLEQFSIHQEKLKIEMKILLEQGMAGHFGKKEDSDKRLSQ